RLEFDWAAGAARDHIPRVGDAIDLEHRSWPEGHTIKRELAGAGGKTLLGEDTTVALGSQGVVRHAWPEPLVKRQAELQLGVRRSTGAAAKDHQQDGERSLHLGVEPPTEPVPFDEPGVCSKSGSVMPTPAATPPASAQIHQRLYQEVLS